MTFRDGVFHWPGCDGGRECTCHETYPQTLLTDELIRKAAIAMRDRPPGSYSDNLGYYRLHARAALEAVLPDIVEGVKVRSTHNIEITQAMIDAAYGVIGRYGVRDASELDSDIMREMLTEAIRAGNGPGGR